MRFVALAIFAVVSSCSQPFPEPLPTTAPATVAPTASAPATTAAAPSSPPTVLATPSAPPATEEPTDTPTNAPTLAPTAVPTATASASPATPSASPSVGCVHFVANPMCSPLPIAPVVAPNSATWVAEQAQPGKAPKLADLQLVAKPNGTDRNDGSEPLYAATAATIAHRIVCDKVPWSAYTCGITKIQDAIVDMPTDAQPQGNADHHLSWNDARNAREVDLWLSAIPDAVAGSDLHVGAGGFCPWAGDGTACSGSTATNIATSLGALDPAEILAAEGDPHGVVPHALGASLLCADTTHVYPANASDGANTNATPACAGHLAAGGRPPEGARWFLDVSDDVVDALAIAPYAKVVLRTLDRDHFGGLVTDTNWSGAPGPALQYRRDGWARVIAEAGLKAGGDVQLPVPLGGLSLARVMRFCATGDCR